MKNLSLVVTLLLFASSWSVFAQENSAGLGVGTLARDVSVQEDGDPAVIPEAVVQSIRRGQEALRKGQGENGAFFGDGRTGPVALGVLALMVDGSSPGHGRYGREVALGVRYLLNQAQPTGLIHAPRDSSPPMYNHGLATLCLAEVWGMTRQPDILPVLKRAVDLIVRCQSRNGGWRYQPAPLEADTSVTVMQVVALRASQNAGIFVPEKTIKDAISYVKGNACKEGGFGYTSAGGPAPARSAAGTISLQLCGEYNAPETRRGLAYLEKNAAGMLKDEYFYYTEYYAMQCMYQARDSAKWNAWYATECRNIMSRQSKENGRWGSLYETGMAILSMGLPYRYLPIYQR